MRSCAGSIRRGLSPELELLLCCARTQVCPDKAARIGDLLLGDLDWERMLHLARNHAVPPLLHATLSAVAPEAIPEEVKERLVTHVRKNMLRNLSLAGTLLNLLSLFRARRIGVVPYKGPLLAVSAYGEIGLRQFEDLDLLVHRRDLPRALDLLEAEGYRLPWDLTGDQTIAFSDMESHCTLSPKKGRFALEVHWEVFPRYLTSASRTGQLWRRLVPVRIMNTEVLTLSPVDLLLITCVRGSRQFWGRLCWLCDVAELVRGYREQDWETALARAEEMGFRRAVFLGLLLARDLLGADVPPDVSQRIADDSTVKRLALQVTGRLADRVDNDASILERLRLHLKLRERLADRIQYGLRRGLAPTLSDWAFLPISPCPYGVYYFVRPVRLFLTHGLTALAGRRLKRGEDSDTNGRTR